ncbi:Signal peptidase complex catalytic subunit, partial [Cladochytrium tenue]
GANLIGQRNAIKMLHSRIQVVQKYVEDVEAGMSYLANQTKLVLALFHHDHDMFESVYESFAALGRLSWRQVAHQSLNFFLILTSALMIWKGLAVFTNSESPIVVVLSESMEPAFQRGDLLFLTMGSEPVRAGEICVFKIKGKDVPIVHRVIEAHDEYV